MHGVSFLSKICCRENSKFRAFVAKFFEKMPNNFMPSDMLSVFSSAVHNLSLFLKIAQQLLPRYNLKIYWPISKRLLQLLLENLQYCSNDHGDNLRPAQLAEILEI